MTTTNAAPAETAPANTRIATSPTTKEPQLKNVTIERTVAAPPSAVWAVLADFPNIADWNDGVTTSYSVSDATEGVGAQRQCDLAPDGKIRMRETVTEWVPEERLTIAIDQIEKMPVKSASMTFTLAEAPGQSGDTALTMSYDYDPTWLAVILGPMMKGQMAKGFNGFVDSLEPAAQARSST